MENTCKYDEASVGHLLLTSYCEDWYQSVVRGLGTPVLANVILLIMP